MRIPLISPASLTSLCRMLIAIAGFQFLLSPSLADEAESVTRIEECRAIGDTGDRLLCYDTIADGGVFTARQAEQVKREEFGITKKEPETEASLDRISVTIVRIQNGSAGTQYFHTADGAVWKKNDRGRWGLETPFEAELKAGVMGAFFLVTEGGKSARVERIR